MFNIRKTWLYIEIGIGNTKYFPGIHWLSLRDIYVYGIANYNNPVIHNDIPKGMVGKYM